MKRENYNERETIEQLRDSRLRAAAFSAIVNRYSRQIYWHIRRMVLLHEDADDLTQETFIKAWNSIEKFRGDSQISTWLYRIAINETLTFLEKNRNNTISLNSPEGAIANSIESDAHFCGDRADALFHEAIGRLPHKQRTTFIMKYFDEMKYEEISQILGTSTGALKASYHIAVKKIEQFLKDND
ncbi:MAG: sigma-70 family RNA polymerase sigma factor [Bacteroidaceae bacterium]|nr:sigma-70 family RNA polymerase sigma factor [Bacteroidaceae bacterium]